MLSLKAKDSIFLSQKNFLFSSPPFPLFCGMQRSAAQAAENGGLQMEEALRLSYEEDTVIAEIGGEIDHHRAVSVRSQIDEALFTRMPKNLVIDVGRVDFMDSSGLGLIMGRLAKAKEIGATLILRNPSTRVTRMLKMAGLDRIIQTTKT
jgi:stage II sporulation protein AA (anti-sigma F factor antagonist)